MTINHLKYVLFAAFCGLLLVAALPQAAAAQATISFAQLNGTVQDPSSQVIFGATIELRNTGTNRTYNAVTNTSGTYVVPNLPPGRYEMSVSYTGFAPYKSTLEISVGQTATVNVVLSVAGTNEQVTITDATPALETARTEVSDVIDTDQISSLPVSGRLFTDFALLTPGVATGRTSLGTVLLRNLRSPRYRLAASVHSATWSPLMGRISLMHERCAAFDTPSGGRFGIPRREQQLWHGIWAGSRRNRQRGYQIRNQ